MCESQLSFCLIKKNYLNHIEISCLGLTQKNIHKYYFIKEKKVQIHVNSVIKMLNKLLGDCLLRREQFFVL